MNGRKYKGEFHFVYDTLEDLYEAKGKVNIVENWRDGRTGDWIKTDDGKYVQVLRYSESKNGKIGIILTCVGTFTTEKRTFMDSDISKHKDMHCIGVKGPGNPDAPITNRDLLFLSRLIANPKAHVVDVCLATYPGKSSVRKAYDKLSYVLKKKEALDMIKKITANAFKDLDIGPTDVIKEIWNLAKSEDIEAKTKLESCDKLLKLMDAYPDPKHVRRGALGPGSSQGEISDAEWDDIDNPKITDGQ